MNNNKQQQTQDLIHREFEYYANQRPDAIAIKYCQQQLSYAQLNGQANHLAQLLIKRGCQPGDTVALMMDRSPKMIATILAILKVGCAYLPLDAANPLQRNLLCLDEANVSVIIADNDCEELQHPERFIIDANEADLWTSFDAPNISLAGATEDKCYVMYTSGSTGKPKGVVIAHRSVIRLVKHTNYVDIKPTDSILQFAPLSFDASTFEIWGALLNGATLVIYSGGGLDPNLFAREVKDNQITVMWLTAALFHMMATRYVEVFSTVKTLLAGGDVLSPKLINAVLDAHPQITVINGYGPTENTTFTCCHRMNNTNRPDGTVPIGIAIEGTAVHILDEHQQPVKSGEEGELYTSGLGVALGYMDSAQQGNFFHNPQIAPGLIYRTGDLVAQNEHQALEFRGRIDNLVKVRGFRVSLEEVQSNILKLDKINQALVVLHKFEGGDQQLVTYLNLQADHGLTAMDIKKLLAKRIPKYMIPDLIHLDKELPINKNGKIDKKHASIVAFTDAVHAEQNTKNTLHQELPLHKG